MSLPILAAILVAGLTVALATRPKLQPVPVEKKPRRAQ